MDESIRSLPPEQNQDLPELAEPSAVDASPGAPQVSDLLEFAQQHAQAANLYLDPDDLSPNRYLVWEAYLPAAVHNRLVDEIKIDSRAVVQDAVAEFRERQAATPLTILGWNHTQEPSHILVAELVSQITDPSGTVVCVEYPPKYQEAIDQFLATGVFREGDNPELYQAIYDWANGPIEHVDAIPTELRGTYFDEFSFDDSFGILELYRVMEAARAKGLEVVTIDPVHDMESEERDAIMLEGISQQIARGKKVVAVQGNLHAHYDGYEYQGKHYESVAGLARARYGSAVKSWIIQSDNQGSGESEGEISQPVLYDAARHVTGYPPQQALRVTEGTFPNAPELRQAAGCDYYVPVLS